MRGAPTPFPKATLLTGRIFFFSFLRPESWGWIGKRCCGRDSGPVVGPPYSPVVGEDRRNTDMYPDDEAALLALVDDDPVVAAGGRTALAERYYPELVEWLVKRFGARDHIAETAAGDAIMRLFKKVGADLDCVDPQDSGVLRWLKKVALDAARDRMRWIRRKQALGLQDDPALGELPEEASAEPRPDQAVQQADQAADVFAVIDGLDEPFRSILLYDLLGAYEELRGEARVFHDQEFIDAAQEHEIYTRDRLRSYRSRIRKKLGPQIHRLLGVPYDE